MFQQYLQAKDQILMSLVGFHGIYMEKRWKSLSFSWHLLGVGNFTLQTGWWKTFKTFLFKCAFLGFSLIIFTDDKPNFTKLPLNKEIGLKRTCIHDTSLDGRVTILFQQLLQEFALFRPDSWQVSPELEPEWQMGIAEFWRIFWTNVE